mmetsp:Transcript_9331/g.38245  ORF Transcript_9331/g.38245 Transcript_9331/m.38245 type:complete len:218 (-) Transcript_9331:795-1448(-)
MLCGSAALELNTLARCWPSCFATCAVAGKARRLLSARSSICVNAWKPTFSWSPRMPSHSLSMALAISPRCGKSLAPAVSTSSSCSLSRKALHCSSDFPPQKSRLAASSASGRSTVAQSPSAKMRPPAAVPLTRSDLSVARLRMLAGQDSGSSSQSVCFSSSHSGCILMPVDHTHAPKGMALSSPVTLSAMMRRLGSTAFTSELSLTSKFLPALRRLN